MKNSGEGSDAPDIDRADEPLAPTGTPDPTDWGTWNSLIEGGLRNQSWKSAGRWALETLGRHLGHDWPHRAWTKYSIPTFLAWSSSHTIAFAQLLEVALRVELLRDHSGAGKLRRVLRQDPREEQIAHLALQLELGGLALQQGYDVAFEQAARSSQPIDVEIRLPNGPVGIETFAILEDDHSRTAHREVDDLFAGIQRIEWRHGVSFRIAFFDRLTPLQAEVFLSALDHAASRGGDDRRELVIEGIAVEMFPDSHADGSGLSGPAIGGDLWPRMAGLLTRKAEQARGSGASWLRVDALQGLWQFTEWSALPLVEKLGVLRDALQPLLRANAHIAGLVITSGPAMAQGVFENEEVKDGGLALRRLLEPLRVRETIVIASDVGPSEGRTFAGLYSAEPSWLGWALSAFGLPSVDEIFNSADPPAHG